MAARSSFSNALKNLRFLEKNAVPVATLIRKQAIRNFETGNINVIDLTAAMKKAMQTDEMMLEAKHQLQLIFIHIQYLKGNN